MTMLNTIGYVMGEPEIGEITQPVFRNAAALRNFIYGLPEKNVVDLYEVTGTIVEDDGEPDGLVMLVLRYMPFKFGEN